EMFTAIDTNNTAKLSLLIQKKEVSGFDALKYAGQKNNIAMIESLLNQGIHDAYGRYYESVLSEAFRNRNFLIADLLIEKADRRQLIYGGYGSDALQTVASQGLIQYVKILIDKGVRDSDSLHSWGNVTALEMAAINGHDDCVEA